MADIHQHVTQLQPAFAKYRQAWASLRGQLEQAIAPMDPSTREFAVAVFQRELPGVASEPEFARLAGQSVAGPKVAAESAAATELELVGNLSSAVRPGEPRPSSAHEARRFLQCVEDVLRASAKAFIELQKGQEQFGNEMGVRTIKEFTPLHAATTAENVLRYLLDWEHGGPHRTQELVGVYADLMIHQVALINGIMEGARGLLARLDPGEIERAVTTPWPARGTALWRAFAQRYHQLRSEDRLLTEAIFGPEFARAYAEVGGEGTGNP